MLRAVLLAVSIMPVVAASAQSLTIAQQTTIPSSACDNMTLGLNGALNGFVPSPNDPWHQDISAMPVDANSNTIMNTDASDLAYGHLHPDFGTTYGIPYNVVDTAPVAPYSAIGQQAIPMEDYPNDSDLTTYPVWNQLAVEGDPGQCPTDGNDRHLIVLDRHSCTNYELYQAALCNGKWTASNGLLFDMLTTEQRPYGLTSADASGLSVFEGLIRYDEILAGVINHAIRFTTNQTKDDANDGYFEAPATHAAGTLWGTDDVMGMRIRLKASFDISGYSATNQIILTAMKKYGLILTDNGSKLYFQGTTDSRWNDNDLENLQNIASADFEVVQQTPAYDANTAPTGPAPVISNFKSVSSTYEGTNYTLLSATVTGATYSYLNVNGINTGSIFRGAISIPTPTVKTTYTLTSRNLYGTTQATITVKP